mmetsp:Transcript_45261/g.119610  ORF Transcript_45261/g.119610 Transcript_45261/m.119610 type:complete len:316 (+) Transcript_45261:125-1072(+)
MTAIIARRLRPVWMAHASGASMSASLALFKPHNSLKDGSSGSTGVPSRAAQLWLVAEHLGIVCLLVGNWRGWPTLVFLPKSGLPGGSKKWMGLSSSTHATSGSSFMRSKRSDELSSSATSAHARCKCVSSFTFFTPYLSLNLRLLSLLPSSPSDLAASTSDFHLKSTRRLFGSFFFSFVSFFGREALQVSLGVDVFLPVVPSASLASGTLKDLILAMPDSNSRPTERLTQSVCSFVRLTSTSISPVFNPWWTCTSTLSCSMNKPVSSTKSTGAPTNASPHSPSAYTKMWVALSGTYTVETSKVVFFPMPSGSSAT